MKKVRRTVTLDAELVREATELCEGTLSAVVERGLLREIQRAKLAQLLEDDYRERGPVPDDVVAQVRRDIADLDRA